MMSPSRPMRHWIMACIGAVLLAACSRDSGQDRDRKQETGPPSAAPAVQDSTDSQKFNAYVDAINRYLQDMNTMFDMSFAHKHEVLSKVVHENDRIRQLAWKMNSENRLRAHLEYAIALPGSLPAVDEATRTLLDAIRKMEALGTELEYYSETNAYLTDDERKDQRIARQLLPLLEQAQHAFDGFHKAMNQEGDARMRREMEQAQEGTPEKYRVTFAWQAKRIHHDFHEAFAEVMEQRPPPPPLLEQIAQDLQAFDANAQAYLAYIAANQLEQQCQSRKWKITGFLAQGRRNLEILRRAEPWQQWLELDRRDFWSIKPAGWIINPHRANSFLKTDVDRPLEELVDQLNDRRPDC